MTTYMLVIVLLALTCSVAFSFEPSPLQDFCIADSTSSGSSCQNLLNEAFNTHLFFLTRLLGFCRFLLCEV
ncbi:hypothetical protein FRX31_011097 [Thalictrum thalictroides]|uniref:Transmembrane protein n=1 Tax=Thalictrum thalictroides TaxID=46969 RepID=A0A7J6WPL8_THATH|nr:hypothetical protein FRX31_011097 [Thalictrum thalictroides]